MNNNRANIISVENVPTFRRYQSSNEICMIPEISQKRKLTDVPFLVVFSICIVVSISLMIYTSFNSNIYRFINGYDDCGNVCGSKNSFIEGIPCSGQDMTDKPITLLDGNATCTEKCENGKHTFEEDFNRCHRGSFELDFFSDTLYSIQKESTELIILCLISLGLSVATLVLFRYYLVQFIWTMMVMAVLLLFSFTGWCWYAYTTAVGVIFTIIAIVFTIWLLILTIYIKLMIPFFKETIRIIFSMPLILLEPVLIVILNIIVIAFFFFTFWLMASSGNLEESDYWYYEKYEYVLGTTSVITLYWTAIMAVWVVQLILACQQMIISGAVATYYFNRDKLTVVSPIYLSFYNLIRYHIGSVAFGSFAITLIFVVKVLLTALSRNSNAGLRLIYRCFKPLEDLVKYVTSMGYVETAIHGQPLCRSGVRAIHLIVCNLLSAVALNAVTNFIFFMVKLTVVAVIVVPACFLNLSTATIVLSGITALLCIHCCFVVFEIAVDALFLCYCEDQCINDGNDNPYCTTVYFHQQIKRAQAVTIAMENAKRKKK